MKNSRRNFIKLASGLIVPAAAVGMPGILSATVAPRVIFSGRNTATVPVLPPTDLIKQGFEGTGYDNGEAWTTHAGSPDPDSTSNAFDGTHSLHLPADSSAVNSPTFAAQSVCSVYFTFYYQTTAGSGRDVITLLSAGVTQARMLARSTGNLQIYHGTSFSGNHDITTGTRYHIWLEYEAGAGDGILRLFVATDETKPGSATLTRTNGDSTGSIDQIRLGQGSSNQAVVYVDKVRVRSEVYGSNPT